MSNLRKRIDKIKINDKDYIMTFDMTSIDIFKEITGKSFLGSIANILAYDDKVILGFMASSIREVDNQDEPLGVRLYEEFDTVGLLLNYSFLVINNVMDSLPKDENSKKKKN